MKNIYQSGYQSYYDKVPRYKNSYFNSDFRDIWFAGWDSACTEHELFTKNQTLEAQNKELSKANEELKNTNKELCRIRANAAMSLFELQIYVSGRNRFSLSPAKLLEYINNSCQLLKVPE